MKQQVHSLAEAIADYEEIVGDRIQYDGTDVVNVKVLPNFHFLIWAVLETDGERYFWIGETYGNMREFAPFIDEVMEQNGLETIITATPRDGRAHVRKWKMERLPERDFYSVSGKQYRVLKGTREGLMRSLLW